MIPLDGLIGGLDRLQRIDLISASHNSACRDRNNLYCSVVAAYLVLESRRVLVQSKHGITALLASQPRSRLPHWSCGGSV